MIFSPALSHKILNGHKTMTRRLVHPSEVADTAPDGTILQVRRRWSRRGRDGTTVRYKVATPLNDSTYAVQTGRGKPGEFRIRLTGIRRERLGGISFDDARAEGFRTRDEFAAYWLTIHDPLPVPQDGCCVACGSPALISTGCLTCGTQDQHLALATLTADFFAARQADRDVWVLSFELDRDHADRWLAARPSPDYVSSPSAGLPGEPPAVDEDTQKRITARAGMESAQWQALEAGHRARALSLVSAEEAVRRTTTHAQQTGAIAERTIRRELWLLARDLQKVPNNVIEQRLRRVNQRIEQRAA